MIKIFNSVALGKRVKHFRKRKGLSQAALSRICNTSQTRISELERGNISLLNIYKLSCIAQALDTNLDELLCDSLEIFSNNKNNTVSIYQMKLEKLLTTLEKEDGDFYINTVQSLIKYKKQIEHY